MKPINSKYKSRILMLLSDAVMIATSFFLTWVLIYFPGGETPSGFFSRYWGAILFVFEVILPAAMAIFGCYRSVWKYTATSDILRVVAAIFVSIVFWIALRYASGVEIHVRFMILFGFLSAVLLSMPRFAYKIMRSLKHYFTNKNIILHEKGKRVLIYGAGYTGRAIIEQYINNNDGYSPVGIIDDDVNKKGITVSGVKVFGGREALIKTVKELNADLIVIAIQESSKQVLKEIYQICASADKPVKIVPKVSNADTAIHNAPLEVRDIKMEELLGRDEFETNMSLINHFIKDKTVLVTGGAGSIGSELCRQALQFGCAHLIILDAHENSVFLLNQELSKLYPANKYSLEIASVRDRAKLKAVFDKYKPQVVFHAAAYKHVPMMELSPVEAVKNNVFGTKAVIDQCNASGVKNFILISSDKAVNPANVMGASKRIAEMLVQTESEKSSTQLAAVRFGNVLGSNGSVVGIFLEQIKRGGPVTLTHREIKRYFMTIPEAVRLVLQAGALASRGEVFVLDMGDPVFIYDLAVDLIKMHGLQPDKDVKIEVTGLRQGEKLFEELKFDGESCDKTMHEGIFVCKLEGVDKTKFKGHIAKLKSNCEAEDNAAMVKSIFEIVPSIYRDV